VSHLADIYRTSLATLTDLYQLTMAAGYLRLGMAERDAVFHLTFRRNPFGGGFAIAAGLDLAVDLLTTMRFDADDLAYIADLRGNDGKALFGADFIDRLGSFRFTGSVEAMPEGTVAFAHEPLVRVRAPLLEAQVVESVLLNLVNFGTLIATKAARIRYAAGPDAPIIDFGLRRAQGPDGALSASRAAYIGGVDATSNVLAGRLHGLPVRGTHAHAWVLSFADELSAFAAYAKVMPNNCVFLVDTYDTLDGVRNAVTVGKQMRADGHEMIGVRLDSGDLAYLSIEARKILDAGGFKKAVIVASNDLDEHIITSLRGEQGARIDVWGVGTNLITAKDEPALGGVYKLAALREPDGTWRRPIKLSEQAIKISTPGILGVRRFTAADGTILADMIHDELLGEPDTRVIVDPFDITRRRQMRDATGFTELLLPAIVDGERAAAAEPLAMMRARAADGLARLHQGVRRLTNPHEHPVGLEAKLASLRTDLIIAERDRTYPEAA
jgi:nicotinate phosphoribosyltransferase